MNTKIKDNVIQINMDINRQPNIEKNGKKESEEVLSSEHRNYDCKHNFMTPQFLYDSIHKLLIRISQSFTYIFTD